MKRTVLILMIVLFAWAAKAQSIKDTSLLLNMFSFHVSGHVPGGDIADRYGMNIGAGGSYMLKFKSNWMLSADFSFFSGNNFKEEHIFDNVTDKDGIFINIYGEIGEATFYERGFFAVMGGGKILPIIGPNQNRGLILRATAGVLQYKTLIHQDGEDIPILNGDNTKGYDYLTNGFGVSQFIGYFHLDGDEPVNFYVGLEFHQAWTKNRRDWNFDTMGPDNRLRNDFLFGVRFGWIFPVTRHTTNTYYY